MRLFLFNKQERRFVTERTQFPFSNKFRCSGAEPSNPPSVERERRHWGTGRWPRAHVSRVPPRLFLFAFVFRLITRPCRQGERSRRRESWTLPRQKFQFARETSVRSFRVPIRIESATRIDTPQAADRKYPRTRTHKTRRWKMRCTEVAVAPRVALERTYFIARALIPARSQRSNFFFLAGAYASVRFISSCLVSLSSFAFHSRASYSSVRPSLLTRRFFSPSLNLSHVLSILLLFMLVFLFFTSCLLAHLSAH